MRALSLEERAEYDALLDEVVEANHSTGARASALIDGLDDAIQAHRPWALPVLRELAYAGAQRAVTEHVKRRAPRSSTKSGRSKATVAGRRIEVDGVTHYEQRQLTLFTREQLAGMLDRAGRQIVAERDNIEWAKSLLALMDKHPSAATVAEALSAEGVSIEAWLQGSAA